MTFRTGILTAIALLCHLVLTPGLLTSQLQPPPAATSYPNGPAQGAKTPAPAPAAAPGQSIIGKPKPGEPIIIKADRQEKNGEVYSLHGHAEVTFRTYILRGDELTYNRDTGQVDGQGRLSLDGGPHDEHVTASRGTYNVETDYGRFYDVVGTTGVKLRGNNMVLTSSTPFAFRGAVVDKLGPDKFVVHHGMITSCKLPRPKWTLTGERIDVVPGENAKMYHGFFNFMGLPVFYLPFSDVPVERLGRQSGFLLPNIGRSSTRGYILGDGFYWAINRSMDATIGAEYFSLRGWAQRATFRAKPNQSESSSVFIRYFGVVDRGLPGTTQFITQAGTVVPVATPGTNEGGEELWVDAQQQFSHDVRAVAAIDYLSSYLFRVGFAESYTEAINSEVKSTAFVEKNTDGYALSTMVGRYQNFESTTPGDAISIVHAPSVEASTVERRISSSPFFWSFDGTVDGLSRREASFSTPDVVGRFDAEPRVALPLLWKGFILRPELGVSETHYTDGLAPSSVGGIGATSGAGINRQAVDTAVEFRPPAVERIFDLKHFRRTYKHVIEPSLEYRYVTGVNNANNILRFDGRDILSDTNEVEAGVTQRLYAKNHPAAGCDKNQANSSQTLASASPDKCNPAPREILSWEVAVKYFFDPTFGGALISGQRNVFTTSAEFTGIAFLTGPRNLSPVVSRLRIPAGSHADVEWDLDYDTKKGRINSSLTVVNYKLPKNLSVGGAHFFLQAPGEVATATTSGAPVFNQFRASVNYGNSKRVGLNTAASAGFDLNPLAPQPAPNTPPVKVHNLQYAAVESSYNWNCCGVTAEYRRYFLPGVGGVLRNENEYRFALNLTNIGTFGTLRKQERLF